MKSKDQKTDQYPFYYPGSGIAYARKSMTVFVCFESKPSDLLKEKLLSGRPSPLESFEWKDRCLEIYNNDDVLPYTIASEYKSTSTAPTKSTANDAQWKSFNKDIEKWLLEIHNISRIAVVVKSLDEDYKTIFDEWHLWSMKRVNEYLPKLSQYIGNNNDQCSSICCYFWIDYFNTLNYSEKEEVMSTLSLETISTLEKYLGKKTYWDRD